MYEEGSEAWERCQLWRWGGKWRDHSVDGIAKGERKKEEDKAMGDNQLSKAGGREEREALKRGKGQFSGGVTVLQGVKEDRH